MNGDAGVRIKRGARALVVAACVLATTACMTVGREFPTSEVGQLQIGKTTRDDVHRIFGEPWRTGIEDGRRTWTYGHYKYKLFGEEETRDLVIRFDAKGVVVSYTFNAAPPLPGSV